MPSLVAFTHKRYVVPWWALGVAFAVGCASFRVPPYSTLVRDTDLRTRALQKNRPVGMSLNRAAVLPGRSQAEIKTELEGLWHPSLNPLRLVNYNGLVATRYSQWETKPGPMFHPGELEVDHLGQKVRVPYIAAFHAGKRLPLVVGISGINGTVDGKITVDILENLYASGGFHVIHLESITSVSHQVRNQRPYTGGFPEGLLLYQLITELRTRSEFKDQIDQVHLLGVSYGGLLCGIAAHCEDVFHGGMVDGAVLAFSPPLDLKILFQNLQVLKLIHDHVHDGYVAQGREQFLRPGGFGLSDQDLADLSFDSYIRKVAFPYVQTVYPALQAEFPDLRPMRDPEDLYAISSLRPFLPRLGTPFFFVSAYDDPVCSPEDHFHQVLDQCSNPLVDGMLLKDGGHLGFDLVCGYPFTSLVAERYYRYWSAGAAGVQKPR